MVFSKRFPKSTKKGFTEWTEVGLTDAEEKIEEQRAREGNIRLMEECVDDAKRIIKEKGLKRYQTDLVSIAIALFDKRASHAVYWKERKAKEKFQEQT